MIDSTDLSAEGLSGLAVALGIGLLVGIERERSKGQGPTREVAGVRTFVLLGLGGAVAQLLGPSAIAVAGVFLTMAMYLGYRRTQSVDPGLTTEMAMLVVLLLGVLAMHAAALAAALGVVVVAVLASKSRLHRFSREQLTQQELHDLLLLVAAAFVVLPLLPDRAIDPWGALNPHKLWLLVVAVMGVSSAGYVALRVLGSRIGLAVAGLTGGFVSSTATIAAMGDRARASPELVASFAGAGLLSNVGTVVQLGVVLAAMSSDLLLRAAVPLAVTGVVAVAVAALSNWRALESSQGRDGMVLAGKRPFEPRRVLVFVAVLATIMLLAAIARQWLGAASLPWVLAASGLADVHAAAASAAQLVGGGQIDTDLALMSITAAFATNSLSKCVVAFTTGGSAYAWRVAPGVAMMVAAFVITSWLT